LILCIGGEGKRLKKGHNTKTLWGGGILTVEGSTGRNEQGRGTSGWQMGEEIVNVFNPGTLKEEM